LSEAVQAAPQTASECAAWMDVDGVVNDGCYREIRGRIRSEQSWACRNARLWMDVSVHDTASTVAYHSS
jgi:hypothetical protein